MSLSALVEGVAGGPAFETTRRRIPIEGIAIAAVMLVVIGVVAWQTMPIPERIGPGVMRRGMLYGLVYAVVVGVVGSVVALYLIARAFASFTGW